MDTNTTTMSKRKKDESDDQAGAQKKAKTETGSEPDVAVSAFKALLDFSCLDSKTEILERFEQVAAALLHQFHIVVKNGDTTTRFEILELEFYLQKEECHEDPFTHGSEEQKISGKWYFHRAPRRSADSSRSATSLTGYRGGTRKGLDLTIGRLEVPAAKPTSSPYFSNATEGQDGAAEPPTMDAQQPVETSSLLRGGALLRSIRRVSDQKIVSGPSLLVDQILQLSKASSIAELVEQKWSKETSAFDSSPTVTLFLEARPPPSSSRKPPVIYRSPRIGLDLSHPGTTPTTTHPRVVFLSRPYRYFVHPELLVANGRSQTFLGILHFCLDAGHTLGSTKLRAELSRITGIKELTVDKYLADYREGVRAGRLTQFVGPKGKGVSSSPGPYLMMMGTLDNLKDSEASQ